MNLPKIEPLARTFTNRVYRFPADLFGENTLVPKHQTDWCDQNLNKNMRIANNEKTTKIEDEETLYLSVMDCIKGDAIDLEYYELAQAITLFFNDIEASKEIEEEEEWNMNLQATWDSIDKD